MTDDTELDENIERLRDRWRSRKQGLRNLFDSDEGKQSDTEGER